jgi:DNA polymerase-3 subunit delta'
MSALAEVLGQERAVEQLERVLAGRRLAHAYLFSGPAGVGKHRTALALARALNCDGGHGCGECLSCQKIIAGTHPDLILIQRDGASIKIAQVRALEQHLAFPPHEGRVRVIVIDGAEQFTVNAANALLKALEEPRRSTLFLLLTAALHQVIPTLRSRCQQVRFPPLRDEVLEQILMAAGVSAQDREAAIPLAEGSATRALELAQGDGLQTAHALTKTLLAAAQGATMAAVFEAAGNVGRNRDQLEKVVEILRLWLRNQLVALERRRGSSGPSGALLLDQTSAAQATRVALLWQLRSLYDVQHALQRNANPTMAIETLALDLRRGFQVTRQCVPTPPPAIGA